MINIKIDKPKSTRRTTKKRKSKKKTSNVVLILMAIFLLIFTVSMIVIFIYKESVPDVLITCVFSACVGEFSVLGWIKTSKVKNDYRKEIEEDEE